MITARDSRTPMPATHEPRKPRKAATILLVDKHPVCCEGLESIIRRDKHLRVCGHFHDAPSAIAAVAKMKPDLVIVDVDLPGRSGIELLRDLRAIQPELPVLVVSMHEERIYAEWVIRAGGRGYASKDSSPERILKAIDTVLGGGIYASDSISAQLLKTLANPMPLASTSPIPQLTDREFEVFRLVGQGKDGHEIANTLNLSIKTVDTHRAHIKEKLQLKTPSAVTHYATLWMAGLNR